MNPNDRSKALNIMIDMGMQEMTKGKTKYTIFGHEFSPRKQLESAADFVQRTKALVDEAVKVSREAALAWAGVCVILPILTNALEAEKANQEGFIYITSRVPIYVELHNELRQRQVAGLTGAVQNQIVVIYQHIIDYQLRTVLRLYMKKIERVNNDTFKSKGWKELVSKVKALEQTLDVDLRKLNDDAIIKMMGDLKEAADKSVETVMSLYPTPPAHSSQHHSGSGHNIFANGDMMSHTGGGSILNHPSFSGEVRFG